MQRATSNIGVDGMTDTEILPRASERRCWSCSNGRWAPYPTTGVPRSRSCAGNCRIVPEAGDRARRLGVSRNMTKAAPDTGAAGVRLAEECMRVYDRRHLDSFEVVTSMAMVLAEMASVILEKDPSTDSIKDVVDDLIEDLTDVLRAIVTE